MICPMKEMDEMVQTNIMCLLFVDMWSSITNYEQYFFQIERFVIV